MAKCIARHGLWALLMGLDGKREISWGWAGNAEGDYRGYIGL